ncbi:hypothetical protein V2I52_09895 [Brenneria sp. g21c3]|uniref:hypothetical protein n=1 Tax=Brenneria sp. g21c3 TaxID=3093893 RepID=UPI002EC20139|nr:hypothetical protein [Brenneria sp. g21c3]
MFPIRFHDAVASQDWLNVSQNAEGDAVNQQRYHTPPSSPQSPHPPSSPDAESSSSLPGGRSHQQMGLSILSRFHHLFSNGENSNAARPAIGGEEMRRYVHKAYKDLRYYHGTNKASLDNIRANGMNTRLKRPGATDTALNDAPQSQSAVHRARQYNYFTTIKGAAKSYALPACVTNTRDWTRKSGDDGIPKIARLFKTADFPPAEKDTDFPIPIAFINPLYRTSDNIPPHAVRQAQGDGRYSEAILTAIQKRIEDKFNASLSLQQIESILINGAESDSDDDFR